MTATLLNLLKIQNFNFGTD